METILREFEGVQLGDGRLDKRVQQIAMQLVKNPGASFPKIFQTKAAVEAFYRLIENPRVSGDALLEPHILETRKRIEECTDVLVLHDTSECSFGGERLQLGRLAGKKRGLLLHLALAIEAGEARKPLGVIARSLLVRKDATPTALRKAGISQAEASKLPSEMTRWWDLIDEVESTLDGRSVIHVMDSEADDFTLMARLLDPDQPRRFVTRQCYDRRLVQQDPADAPKLMTQLSGQETLVCRQVALGERAGKPEKHGKRHQKRRGRTANLAVSAAPLCIKRPKNLTSEHDDLPEQISVNAVHVRELNPPENEEPVEWVLLTSEPINTTDQILAVIDNYRSRWVIEEFFKCLKTGCSYEKRQIESSEALDNTLSLYLPIVYSILLLRTVARSEGPTKATDALSKDQIEILTHRYGKPILNAQDALRAVACLGGHNKSNGEPGWLVLWRGYRDLMLLEEGLRTARAMYAKM